MIRTRLLTRAAIVAMAAAGLAACGGGDDTAVNNSADMSLDANMAMSNDMGMTDANMSDPAMGGGMTDGNMAGATDGSSMSGSAGTSGATGAAGTAGGTATSPTGGTESGTRVNSQRGAPPRAGTDGVGDPTTSTNNESPGGSTPTTRP